MKLRNVLLTGMVALLTAGISVQANAQNTFKKGTSVASALLGLSANFSSYSSTLVPPLQLTYEYALVDNLLNGKASIGVGGTVGYSASRFSTVGFLTNVSSIKQYLHSALVGARASFHYQFVSKLDAYAGITLGANIHSSSVSMKEAPSELEKEVNKSTSSTSAGFGWGVHLGGRYYFNQNWALNAELGYGFSILAIGATYRF